MGVERGERLVQEQHARVARERPREGDALPFATRELAGPRLRQVRDVEALEQLADTLLAAVRDVRLDAQVREERVLLEDEPDLPLVGPAEEPAVDVDPHVVVERHPAGAGPHQARDHAQDRGLARARGPHERDRALDLEREAQLKGAKREGEVRREGCHERISLNETSSTALIATSSPPIATATSKLTANCS